MATIILLISSTRIYNAGTGDLVEAHNTSVTNLNNELITKLPLAGGTMQGDVNMGSHYITNLPAPVNNADAARLIDTVPAAGSLIGTMLADNTVTADKLNHTSKKQTYDSTGTYTTGAGEDGSYTPVMRSGYITKISVVREDDRQVDVDIAYGTSGYYLDAGYPIYFSADGEGHIEVWHRAALVHEVSVSDKNGDYKIVVEAEAD